MARWLIGGLVGLWLIGCLSVGVAIRYGQWRGGGVLAYAQAGDIWLLDVPTRVLYNVTRSTDDELHVAWSNDGTALAYTSRHEREYYALYTQRANGRGRQAIPTQEAVFYPLFAPNDHEVLFAGSTSDIFMLNLHDGRVRNVTNTPLFEWGGTWSPDGRYIAYVEGITIYLTDSAGGGTHPVGYIGLFDTPQWSPDSRYLAVIGSAQNSVNRITVATGEQQRWMSGNYLYRRTVWSPQGDMLAVWAARGADDEARGPVAERHFILLLGDNGTIQREYPLPARSLGLLSWSPDGEYLVFAALPNGRYSRDLYLLRLRDGELSVLRNDVEGAIAPVWRP